MTRDILSSGGSRGGAQGGPAPPPLFLGQTEAQRAEKIFLETRHPPCLRVWMTNSLGLDVNSLCCPYGCEYYFLLFR